MDDPQYCPICARPYAPSYNSHTCPSDLLNVRDALDRVSLRLEDAEEDPQDLRIHEELTQRLLELEDIERKYFAA